MRQSTGRKRVEDAALSFLEYLVLAVLVIAAAMAGMTFLGTTDGQPAKTGSPASNTIRLRVAAAAPTALPLRPHWLDRAPGAHGFLEAPRASVAGRIES